MKTLTCAEVLRTLHDWVATNEQFYHTRYGDGELHSAFNMRQDSNCDGHRFYPDLGWEMLKTINDVCQRSTNPREKFIIGSNNATHPDMACTVRFLEHLKHANIDAGKIPWSIGDFWWHPWKLDGGNEIIKLFDMLRLQGDVALVCKPEVAGAAKCLGAQPILIPAINAWLHKEAILRQCKDAKKSIYVWAGGMPAKVLSWRLFKEADWPTSHIDIGHTFDGVFGIPSRSWHERKDQHHEGKDHWEFCRDVFNPYVLSFLK